MSLSIFFKGGSTIYLLEEKKKKSDGRVAASLFVEAVIKKSCCWGRDV